MTHGDETGSLPAALTIMSELQDGRLQFGGTVDFIVGNASAGIAGRRFLDADLNRVFTKAAPDSRERRRAIALSPLLTGCDLFIDFHQTARPTMRPFYTLPWRPEEARWIRALDLGAVWITRAPGQRFSPGTCCADEFVRDQGRPGITLELGEKGLHPASQTLAERAMRRALALLDEPDQLEEAAEMAPPVEVFEYAHREPYMRRTQRLRDGLTNFQTVRQGDDLSAEDGEPIIAPTTGMLLFPKYPGENEPLPAELFRIARTLRGAPERIYANHLIRLKGRVSTGTKK